MRNDKLNQRGMTVIEVFVASSVIVLISGIISVMIIKSFLINRYSIEQGLNTSAIQNSLNKFSQYLREAKQSDNGAYLLKNADDFDLVFFADIDNDSQTEKVHYFFENGQLKIGSSKASGFPAEYPEEDQQIKTVGSGIINNIEQPIFYYYGKDYYGLEQEAPLDTPAQVDQIGLVKIDLYVNTDPGHVPNNARIETFIRPRNIQF